MNALWLTSATAAIALTGLAPIAAATDTVRETRTIGAFDRVEFDAAGELRISQGAAASLVVEAEPRVLPNIVTATQGGTLSIRLEGKVQTQAPIRFHLTVRALNFVGTGGSGDVVITALKTPALTLRLGGSGGARIGELAAGDLRVLIDGSSQVQVQRGTVRSQRIEIGGAGSYDATGLHSSDAAVSIRGSGDVRLRASQRLDAEIAGSGQIDYFGQPRVTEHVSGAGEVRRAGP